MERSYSAVLSTIASKPKSIGYIVFIFFWLLVLLLYYPTKDAGFSHDFTGWQETYDVGHFKDIWNSFGYPGMHQVLHLVYFSFYKLFHTWGLPWYVLFTGLHALNGVLCFAVFRRLFTHFALTHAIEKAFVVALVFLLIPYQVEVVAWKTTVHYLLSLGLLMGVLWYLTDYLRTGKNIWKSHLLFLVSLFTLEFSYVTPIVVLIYILFWHFATAKQTVKMLTTNLLKGALPQFIGLGGILLLNQLVLGEAVGHYGSDVHFSIKPAVFLGTLNNYFIKHLAFLRFADHGIKSKIFEGNYLPQTVFFVTGFLVVLLGLYVRYFKRITTDIKISGLGLMLFFVELLPVSTLFFYYILLNGNDRYSYVASLFYSLFLVLLIYRLPTWIRYPILGFLLIISVNLTRTTVLAWNHNAAIHSRLLQDYRWYDEEDVIILTQPDNYKGTFLFRSSKGRSNLEEEFLCKMDRKITGRITTIANYNLYDLNNGVFVRQTNGHTIEVIFKDWGHWWWLDGIGMSDYETDRFKVEHIHKGYRLTLKGDFSESTFIYHYGLRWKEFKLMPD